MTQTRWPIHTLPYTSFPEFLKNDIFLKPALNIFILRNLIEGLGDGVNKEGADTPQSKSWYCLGSFQISKVELFAKIVVGY